MKTTKHNMMIKILFPVVVFEKGSLYVTGCPGTHHVNQASLKLRAPLGSASGALELKVYITMPSLIKTNSYADELNTYKSMTGT